MKNFIHFLNGSFVSEEKLLISPRDLGFTRGYAVADFVVTHNHKPHKLEEHVNRLFKSAAIIGLTFPWTKEQIARWANQTLDKNDKETEKTIKIVISGGVSKSMYQAEIPTIVMMVSEYIPHPASYYEKGVKAVAVKYKRPYPEAKHTNYVEAIMQLAKVKEQGVSEVIYYDETQVYEGAGCNIFAVINNVLVTTKTNIVSGTTRNTLLEILKLPIPIEVRDFSYEELLEASEVLLTGSSAKARGVTHINGRLVGDGKVGKITQEIVRQYQSYISQISK